MAHGLNEAAKLDGKDPDEYGLAGGNEGLLKRIGKMCGSGAVVCSWSLLFTAIIAVVRQKLHLSTCSNLRSRLS
jgi:hypothetical protein